MFNANYRNRKGERVIVEQEKKNKFPSLLNKMPLLSERKNLDSSIITNNRSFVNRASRMTRGQMRGYERGMGQYGLDFNHNTTLSDCLKLSFLDEKNSYHNLVLDIGFGTGKTLVDMACTDPQDLFIGVETFKPGVGALFVQALPLEISNIRVFHGDAVSIMFYMIEDRTLDRIQIFYPDPWPKIRHHKRRMLHLPFVQLCISLLKVGGVIWIVSDWQSYAEYISRILKIFEKPQPSIEGACLRQDLVLQEQLEHRRRETRFERKGIEKGHEIYPMVYIKKQD